MTVAKITRCASLLCALAVCAMGGAYANINPDDPGTVNYLGGGDYQYTFDVVLDNVQDIYTGDFLVFYDIPSLTGVFIAPAGWTATWPAPTQVNLNGSVQGYDNSTITDVQFVRTGGALIGPQALGVFGFVSKTGGLGLGGTYIDAGAQAHRKSGAPTDNHQQVTTVVPEPGSLSLLLPMLAPLGLVLRRRR